MNPIRPAVSLLRWVALFACFWAGGAAAAAGQGAGGETEALVDEGALWRYRTGETDPGTAWREPGFDDFLWAAGFAELGYGDGDEATLVPNPLAAGNSRFYTTYFRRAFTAGFPWLYTGLHLRLKVDDGAVVYLNGAEVVRHNLPGGEIGFETLALEPVSGEAEDEFLEFAIGADALVEGENVIAVEVHEETVQVTSDLSFDLGLSAHRASDQELAGGVEADGVRYSLWSIPPRIVREVVAPGGGPLDPILLQGVASRLWVEEGSIYVLVGGEVVRYGLDGSGPFETPDDFFDPVAELGPPSLSLTVEAGATAVVEVTLSNRGRGALSWEASTFLPSSQPENALVAAGAALDARAETITALIPRRFEFQDGVEGTFIADGGNDMFDEGNILGTDLGAPLPYTGGAVETSPALGAGGAYFTRKFPGLFVFSAALDGVGEFSVSGGLGADGAGLADGTVLRTTHAGTSFTGFVKRVFGAEDPSVNHLIIVPSKTGVNHLFDNSTNDDDHRVAGLEEVGRLHYLLYASERGGYIDAATTLGIMEAYLDLAHIPDRWVSPAPSAGTVPVAGEVTVEVVVDASRVVPGEYAATVTFATDDPRRPEVRTELAVTVLEPDVTVVEQVFDGVRYRLWARPPRIEREPVSPPGGALLDPVFLDAPAGELWVDETGIYTGSDEGVVHHELDGGGSSTLPFDLRFFDPVAELEPGALALGLDAGSTARGSLTLGNAGRSPLRWEAVVVTPQSPAMAGLEAVLEALIEGDEAVTSLIPDRMAFGGGLAGSEMRGSGFMFRRGNVLGTDLGGPILYTRGLIQEGGAAGPAGRYFTFKSPWLFAFAADLDGASEFHTSGTLGAEGQGRLDGAVLELQKHGQSFKGFVKRVYGVEFNGAASVNHLIIVGSRPGLELEHSFPVVTYDDDHRVTGLEGRTRLHYLLFSTDGGGRIDDPTMLQIMEAYLDLVHRAPGWVTAGVGGVIPPGGSAPVEIEVDATGISPAGYAFELAVTGDDPGRPEVRADIAVEVATPDETVAEQVYDGVRYRLRTVPPRVERESWPGGGALGTTPLGAPAIALWVDASGIFVGGVDGSVGRFGLDGGGGTLEPGLDLSFFDPRLEIDPAPVEAALPEGGTGTATVTLRNTGRRTLTWRSVGETSAGGDDLEAVLARLEAAGADAVTALVPDVYHFLEGGFGADIDDGGNDMFDRGNRLKTNLSGLGYSDARIVPSEALGDGGRFFTRKLPGLFVLVADLDGVLSFSIFGGLGANGFGQVDGTVLRGRRGYTGFVKRVFGTAKPSVNHLFIIEDDPAAGHSFPGDTNDDDHDVTGLGQVSRIHYLLFAAHAGGYVDDGAVAALMDAYLDIVSGANGLAGVSPGEGEIPPLEEVELEVGFDVSGLGRGLHRRVLAFASDDPRGARRLEIDLRVEEGAVRPVPDHLRLGALEGVPPDPVTVRVEAGAGGAAADWTVEAAPPWLTVTPGSGRAPAEVSLSFDLAGENARPGAGEVVFRAGSTRVVLPVEVEVAPLNVTRLLADPLRPRVYALNPSDRPGDDGLLLALRPSDGAVLDVLPLRDGPSDVAIGRGSRELFVIHHGDDSIVRVDLDRFEVTGLRSFLRARDYTDLGRYNLAAGEGGELFFTDSSWESEIHRYDFAGGRESSVTEVEGIGTFALAGGTSALIGWRQQGWGEFGDTDSWLYRLDATLDPPVEVARTPGTVPRDPVEAPVLLTAAEDRAFTKRAAYALGDLSAAATFSQEIQAITLGGDVAFGPSRAFDGRTGDVLAALPFPAPVMAVSGDQRHLLLYRSALRRMESLPMAGFAAVPGPHLVPEPLPGTVVSRGLGRLRWKAVPAARAFEVFLGTDVGEVAGASAGSPLSLGSSDGFEVALPAPLAPGQTYYWRVDFEGAGGPAKGEVWSFSVAPFSLDATAVPPVVVVEAGGPPVEIPLGLGDPSGEGVTFTASAPAPLPWLTVAPESGEVPGGATIRVDPASLAPGAFRGSVTVTGGGAVIDVPVAVEAVRLEFSRLVADLDRPVLYGLHPGRTATDDAYVAFIDAESLAVEWITPVGRNPTDLAVHPGEGRLYVTNWRRVQTVVVDLETRRPLAPLRLGRGVTRVNAGRPGRIYFEEEVHYVGVFEVDTGTGEVVRRIAGRALLGDAEVDPTGRFYFRCFENNASNARIRKYDLDQDPALEVAESPRNGFGSRHLIMSRDGSRLFWQGYVYDADLNEIGILGEEIYATTARGEIAFSGGGVFRVASGRREADLPLSTTVMALAPDQRTLFLVPPGTGEVVGVPLGDLVEFPGASPADGERLGAAPSELVFPEILGAVSYDLFLGSDRAELEAAEGAGSPLHLGTSEEARFRLAAPLEPGRMYFWRADGRRGNGNVIPGVVRSFEVELPPGVSLFSLEPSVGDEFGASVALEGDLAVVGAPREDDPRDSWGAAYVFRRVADSGWALEERLSAESGALTNYRFGSAVAVSGDDILVGWRSRGFDVGGAVFFSHEAGSGWREVTAVVPLADRAGNLGETVALLDDHALIGAPERGRGAVLAYRRDYASGGWVPAGELDGGPGSWVLERFGAALALSERWAVVGAPVTTSGGIRRRGRVFFFTLDPASGQWVVSGGIGPPQPGTSPFFGAAVGLEDGWLAVGAPGDEEAGRNAGAVHLYRYEEDPGRWEWRQKIVPPGRWAPIGTAVSLRGGVLAVGSPEDDRSGPDRGALLLFRLSGDRWEPAPDQFPPPGTRADTGFGEAFALSEDSLITGLPTGFDGAERATGRAEIVRLRPTVRRPRFTSYPETRADERVPYRYEVGVADPDPDGGPVELTALALPGWLTLQAEGAGRAVLAGTPGEADVGSNHVRLEAVDPTGLRVTQSFFIEVASTDDPPVITGAPLSVEVFDGQRARLAVAVEGSEPLRFTWFKDGLPLAGAGASGAEFLIPRTAAVDAGAYHVVVTNPAGSAVSDAAELTVKMGTLSGGDWPTYGGGPDRTGYYPISLRGRPFDPLWEAAYGGRRQAAVTRGTVYHSGSFEEAVLFAIDVTTGDEIWRHTFARAASLDAPSYFDGLIYVQRGNQSADTQLWCIDGATGEAVWNAPYGAQWDRHLAPAVTGEGVWISGGTHGGLIGFDRLSGRQLFFHDLPQMDEWTPTVGPGGEVYSWVQGVFANHDPQSGEVLWSVDVGWRGGGSMEMTTAVVGERAFAVGRPGIFAFDLAGRRLDWWVEESFHGSPAVANGVVYALAAAGGIVAFDAFDGSRLGTYGSGGDVLVNQPLVTNDTLIAASEARTYVYSLQGGPPRQEIPHGGALTPYNAILLIASPDGILRAYRVRAPGGAPPVFVLAPRAVAREDEVYRELVRAHDPDLGDALLITAEGLPPWLSLVDNGDGTAWLTGEPGQADVGRAEFSLRASDSAFNPVVLPFVLTVQETNDPPLALGGLTLEVAPAEATSSVAVRGLFSDEEDPVEGLALSVAAVRGAAGLRAAEVDPGTGLLRLHHRPGARGTAEVVVRATDSGGRWAEALVSVVYPEWTGPEIEEGPAGVQVGAGGAVTFSVSATGGDLSYQWRVDGIDLAGETAPTLVVDRLQPGDGGVYTVLVSNAGGSAESGPARLLVSENLPAGVVNRLPLAAGFAPVEGAEDGGPLAVDLAGAFTDPDGAGPLTFTVEVILGAELFQAVTVERESGRLLLLPAPDAHGLARLIVRATDPPGGWTESELGVALRPVNDPPATTGVADLVADPAGGRATVDLRAAFSDVEDGGEGLDFRVLSIAGDPVLAAVSVNAGGGELDLRFQPGAAGAVDLRLRATDREGLSVETVFRVTVPAGAVAARPLAALSLESFPSDRDVDGDGFSDLVEVAFGAGPADPARRPQVRLERAAAGRAGGVRLAWSSARGWRYRVEVSDRISAGGTWRSLGVTPGGDGGWTLFEDAAAVAAGARFYRLALAGDDPARAPVLPGGLSDHDDETDDEDGGPE